MTVRRRHDRAISTVMTKTALSVDHGLSVEALTAYLLQSGKSAVAVTSRGKLVGIASLSDLLREHHDRGDDEAELPSPRQPFGFHATQIARATVGEVMTSCVFALPETASVQEAAALMSYEGVDQLALMGEHGLFTGMISSHDLMAWLARQPAASFVALDELASDPEDGHDGWSELRLRVPLGVPSADVRDD